MPRRTPPTAKGNIAENMRGRLPLSGDSRPECHKHTHQTAVGKFVCPTLQDGHICSHPADQVHTGRKSCFHTCGPWTMNSHLMPSAKMQRVKQLQTQQLPLSSDLLKRTGGDLESDLFPKLHSTPSRLSKTDTKVSFQIYVYSCKYITQTEHHQRFL